MAWSISVTLTWTTQIRGVGTAGNANHAKYWAGIAPDPGWGNDNGVTPDGRRRVVTSWSTEDVTGEDNALA
jgi:hypothetical protein